MNKKVLVSLVLLTMVGASLVFAQAPTLDKLKFTAIDGNKAARVEQANAQISGAVVIPAVYNGLPVTTIGSFVNNKNITSVVIPNSVTTIGVGTSMSNGFSGCSGLTSITLPNSLTTIWYGAFSNTNITSITIPASVEKISGGIFPNSLTSVTFQGSSIEFNNNSSPGGTGGGDLQNKFKAGGAGTYTRRANENIWTKQGGGTVTCPTCGGTGVVHQ